MPMFERDISIREDETSFRLVSYNYYELKRLLDNTEEINTAVRLMHREDIMEQIGFKLHNYLSSVMSFVEHTRRINKKLYENKYPESLEEIEIEIGKRFVNSETHQIIQGLRDYTQHRKLPVVVRSMSYDALDCTPKLQAAYYLSTESLLEWDNWKPLAKHRLNRLNNTSQKDLLFQHQMKDIPINTLVTDHYKEIASFYKWLGNKRRGGLQKTDI